MLLFITAVAVVLVVSFVCSIFESVLLSLTRPQIEVLTRSKKRAGKLLSSFRDNMDVPIAAILILNTAAHTIGASVAGASYANVFDAESLWLFSLIFTLAVLLFTEIIPKTLGVSHATRLAAPVAYGIDILSRILKPLVVVSERISRSLRAETEAPVTSPDEIRLLALLGRSRGVVGNRTAGMIVGATQISHLQAHDVMLPREGVRWLSAAMDRKSALAYAWEYGHSRFPFSPTEDLDDVSGVVLVKDLQSWLLRNPDDDIDWEAIRRDVLVVPRSLELPKLLQTYQENHRHLAVVVNEYGGIEGIATLEDVLEEVVGDIRDESDSPANDMHSTDDGVLVVGGKVDLRRICERLDIPWQPDAEVTTIGGYVTEKLERIPVVGDTVSWNGYDIEVLRADRRRARRVMIRRSERMQHEKEGR